MNLLRKRQSCEPPSQELSEIQKVDQESDLGREKANATEVELEMALSRKYRSSAKHKSRQKAVTLEQQLPCRTSRGAKRHGQNLRLRHNGNKKQLSHTQKIHGNFFRPTDLSQDP